MTLSANPPHVVGVDLSLTATGMAWPDHHTLTHGREGLANPRTAVSVRAQGLDDLADELAERVIGWTYQGRSRPRLLVIEDFPAGNTRIDPERGYLWWRFVRLMTGLWGVPVLPVPPSVVKAYACGMGNANKREVIAGVQQHFPDWPIMKTGKRGNELTTVDENKADAVALCAIGCALLGEPLADLPPRHLRALEKLELPPGVSLS